LEKSELSISYSTIYRGIYSGLFDIGERKASRKLRHKGLNLQSKCNKKRSTHQLEYNFVSTQKPLPNDEYFLPT
ncbi:hypothetical protein ACWJT7_25955, partial [Escherichia coli]